MTGTGSGAQASLGLSPSSLNFSTVAEGSSKTLSSTLTNTGNSDINISSVKVSGAGFSAGGVSGGTILMPGQSTALMVTFSPSSVGSTTGASVTIASNAANSPAIVSLGGAGQAPASHRVALSWNPSSSSDVTGYNVFRAVNSGGYGTNPLNVAPVSGTGYTDASVTAGQTYFYIVTTVGSGVSSTASNEVAATIPTP
ncbi:MAG TPA: choice-of-anchor D domain-containing protein [Candidatus Acidoferrales bacterium]|nr:choice-of-anchor D domain-containing protein [Candidatus Acidoferrales bacterium]